MKTLELVIEVVEEVVEVVRYFYQSGQTIRQKFGQGSSIEEAVNNTLSHFRDVEKKAYLDSDGTKPYKLLIWDKKFGNPKVLREVVYKDYP